MSAVAAIPDPTRDPLEEDLLPNWPIVIGLVASLLLHAAIFMPVLEWSMSPAPSTLSGSFEFGTRPSLTSASMSTVAPDSKFFSRSRTLVTQYSVRKPAFEKPRFGKRRANGVAPPA